MENIQTPIKNYIWRNHLKVYGKFSVGLVQWCYKLYNYAIPIIDITVEAWEIL